MDEQICRRQHFLRRLALLNEGATFSFLLETKNDSRIF
jgi:hypothetical protein